METIFAKIYTISEKINYISMIERLTGERSFNSPSRSFVFILCGCFIHLGMFCSISIWKSFEYTRGLKYLS